MFKWMCHDTNLDLVDKNNSQLKNKSQLKNSEPRKIIQLRIFSFDSKIDEKLNLIETFIDKKSNLIIKKKDSEYKFKPKEHNKNDPELITETLAKILTNQKKYKKAIKAYKILSLKYPKKSSFFADHIKKIKRLEKK